MKRFFHHVEAFRASAGPAVRAWRGTITLVVVYLLAHLAMHVEPLRSGFVAPNGTLRLPVIAFGLFVITIRVLTVALVPLLVGYRITRAFLLRGVPWLAVRTRSGSPERNQKSGSAM